MKKILTTGEIAKYCGVNFRTVIRWIERGNLKAFQLPGRGDNRVLVSDFLDFLSKFELPVPEDFKKKNQVILIVDDEPLMAKVIERVLRRDGFTTYIAEDGFKAGALMGTFCPDLMTIDLKMPGLDGHKVIQFVKTNDHLKNVKILVVSARPLEELQQTLSEGADDFIEKPFDNEALVKKIHQILGKDTQRG